MGTRMFDAIHATLGRHDNWRSPRGFQSSFNVRTVVLAAVVALLAPASGCSSVDTDSPQGETFAEESDAVVVSPTALVLNDQTAAFDLPTGVEKDFSVSSIPGDGRTVL